MTKETNAASQVEIAAIIVNDLLGEALRVKDHAAVLAKAAEFYAADRAEGPFFRHDPSPEGRAKFYQSPGMRHWNAVMRWKARVAYVFVRSVTNDNSPETAKRLLFGHHPGGPGSGYLEEYISDLLPRRQKAEAVGKP